jgi:exonuclease III
MIKTFRPDLICLQETKLIAMNNVTIRKVAGLEYEDNFFFLPVDGTRGIILVAACAKY